MIALVILCSVAMAAAVGVLMMWTVVGWRLQRAVKSGLSVRSALAAESAQDSGDDLVSIVVPAHNEARIIEQCVRSLLAQTWPNFEIIFVADRCTDDTVDIMRRTSDGDPRVRIIENNACPDDWAGKCHAARLGAAGAMGRWLVFMDADTRADPELIHAAIASARARGSAMLSLLTQLTSTEIYERRTQTVASMLLMTLYPPDRVNRETGSRPFANGQFMLFERDWYQRIGGHEAVQDDLLEDIAFSRCINEAGGRVTLLDADGMLVVSMYSSTQAFRRGWQRIFIEACRRKPARMRNWALRLRLLGVVGPAFCADGLLMGGLAWALGANTIGLVTIAIALVALGVQAMVVSGIYRVFHQSRRSLWRFPFGCVDVARILIDGARVLETGEPVVWGGREYVLQPR